MFMRSLNDLKISLVLIQAASAFTLEGTNRATASQIAERAGNDYGIEVTASFTGQTFSSLGIKTTISHGKRRFALDHELLEEIRRGIAAKCEDTAGKLEATLETFNKLPKRIKELQIRWREMIDLRNKERELIQTINEARKTPSRLPYLQQEFQKIQVESTRIKELRKEINALTRQIKKLPSLEETKKALKSKIEEYNNEAQKLEEKKQSINRNEEALTEKEAGLDQRIDRLQNRMGWVELAELQESIENTKKELDLVLRQLGEKRTILDKLLMKNRVGDK